MEESGGTAAATELHFLKKALPRKNREKRTDGGARVVKDRDQLGQARSSGAPGPGSGWA